MKSIKEDLYYSYVDQIYLLEDIIDLEDNFEAHFNTLAIELVAEVEKQFDFEESDDWTEEQLDLLIPAILSLKERIESVRQAIDDKKSAERVRTLIASWSPEKQKAYEEFLAKKATNG